MKEKYIQKRTEQLDALVALEKKLKPMNCFTAELTIYAAKGYALDSPRFVATVQKIMSEAKPFDGCTDLLSAVYTGDSYYDEYCMVGAWAEKVLVARMVHQKIDDHKMEVFFYRLFRDGYCEVEIQGKARFNSLVTEFKRMRIDAEKDVIASIQNNQAPKIDLKDVFQGWEKNYKTNVPTPMHVVTENEYTTMNIPLDLLAKYLSKCIDCVLVSGFEKDIRRRVYLLRDGMRGISLGVKNVDLPTLATQEIWFRDKSQHFTRIGRRMPSKGGNLLRVISPNLIRKAIWDAFKDKPIPSLTIPKNDFHRFVTVISDKTACNISKSDLLNALGSTMHCVIMEGRLQHMTYRKIDMNIQSDTFESCDGYFENEEEVNFRFCWKEYSFQKKTYLRLGRSGENGNSTFDAGMDNNTLQNAIAESEIERIDSNKMVDTSIVPEIFPMIMRDKIKEQNQEEFSFQITCKMDQGINNLSDVYDIMIGRIVHAFSKSLGCQIVARFNPDVWDLEKQNITFRVEADDAAAAATSQLQQVQQSHLSARKLPSRLSTTTGRKQKIFVVDMWLTGPRTQRNINVRVQTLHAAATAAAPPILNVLCMRCNKYAPPPPP